ncbi:hypothetical protein [Burkholderia sp. Ac-20365]|uniref:hypothetical protein n=1 Tax=Burkholderia sp. Ac-20365 TaxID=2703897 RepID=UPI00197C5D22|nr:hypothetical protein [Burkholderia sp. Ac-20365]
MEDWKWMVGTVGACLVATGSLLPVAVEAASFEPGGTVTITGAIVEPPYGISSRFSDNYQGFRSENMVQGSAVDVMLTPALNASPSAHIAVLTNPDEGIAAPRTLRTQFTDNATHIAQSARAGYRVGSAGGTLSIESGADGARAVTVMVSYD